MVHRVGDEVIVSCEPATARVVEKLRYIMVEWPWRTADNSLNIRWNGQVALPYGDSHQEWSPYRLEPAAFALRPGDVCTVSIPATRLYVGALREVRPSTKPRLDSGPHRGNPRHPSGEDGHGPGGRGVHALPGRGRPHSRGAGQELSRCASGSGTTRTDARARCSRGSRDGPIPRGSAVVLRVALHPAVDPVTGRHELVLVLLQRILDRSPGPPGLRRGICKSVSSAC